MPEIIDPVFAKTSQNARFLLSENERFGLVFVKTGSINSGTVLIGPVPDIEVSSKVWGDIFCSETNVEDPDPQQIDKQDPDPDPHQSDMLAPDQFADAKPKC